MGAASSPLPSPNPPLPDLSQVGKSSLLLRCAENTFTENFISTIGVDYKEKELQVGSTKAKIQIWSVLAFCSFPPLLSFPVSSCLCFTFLMTILITQTISGLEFLTLRCFPSSSQRLPQGHCRPRAISHHYFILLPWSSWNDPCFRPCQSPVLPVRGQVDARGLPPLLAHHPPRPHPSQVERYADEGVAIVLAGNKSDLGQGSFKVTGSEIDEFRNARGLDYFQVSAKDNTNVEALFKRVTELAMEHWRNNN